MALSAIVVTYRTGRVLEACLSALIESAMVREIILVDNGNSAAAEAELDAWVSREPKLAVLRGQGNIGYAAGCNLGAAQARAERLLFVNPDAVLDADAPARLAAALDAADGLALLGGDLRCGAGLPERASRRSRVTPWAAFVSFSGLSFLGRWLPAFRDLHDVTPVADAPVRVGAVSGALMAVRRGDYQRLGGMDEGYFLHVDDIDLCRRFEEAGGTVLFIPGPHGVHQRSSSDAPSHLIAKYKAAGFARYFRKFAKTPFERASAELAALAVALILPLRAKPLKVRA